LIITESDASSISRRL
jgi:hypothetical protein